MKAQCHCGAVEISLPGKPAYMNHCNCTLCITHGGVWGYYASREVAIRGETRAYTRTDIGDPALHLHFCGVCGTTTHWSLTEHYKASHPDVDRMGVNMRLVADPRELAGVELRFPDGRNWGDDALPPQRRAPVTVGDDGAF